MAPGKPLKIQIATDEHRSHLCGGAVVVGLIVEVFLAALFPEDSSLARHWAPVFANALVALGVYGEIHFAGRVSKSEERLREIAERDVANANARAAEAELAAARLQAQFAWRRLSDQQRGELGQALTSQPAFFMRVLYVEADPECEVFAREIGAVFKQAGWRVQFTPASFFGRVEFGVRVPLPEPPYTSVCEVTRMVLSSQASSTPRALFPTSARPIQKGTRSSFPHPQFLHYT